ncbi:MAG: hypothetical protein RL109_1983 [Pseudomonadota bacterium]
MSASRHVSETPATQWLRRQKLAFSEHPYDYLEHGGTAESARQLQVDEHQVVKTLVMQDEQKKPLIVLMHGDRKVSTKRLARQIGRKALSLAMWRSLSAIQVIKSVALHHSACAKPCPFMWRQAFSIYQKFISMVGGAAFCSAYHPRC